MKKYAQKGIAVVQAGVWGCDQLGDQGIRTCIRLIRKALPFSVGAVIGLSSPAFAEPQGGQVVGGVGNIQQPGYGHHPDPTAIPESGNRLAALQCGFSRACPFRTALRLRCRTQPYLRPESQSDFRFHRANGRVFLSNPNGIIFGSSARINVGSLFATSLNMEPGDFINGLYEMSVADGESAGVIINQGIINAATGGSVTLVGGAVSNEGLIIADVGYVNLAVGRKAVVDFRGDGSIRFQVDEAVLDNPAGLDVAVNNSGEIRAEGGQVLLSGNAAQDVFTRVVNNDGVIRAGRIDDSGGVIRLVGTGGDVYNRGTLDAVSGNGQGGDIDVLGDRVAIIGDALIDASGATGGGNVRIGGDYQGANPDVQNASHTFVGPDAVIRPMPLMRVMAGG